MMDIYEGSLAQYKRNMRERVPIILALFSEGGGRMILYRPGHEPLVAEPVPIVYQLAKSVSHSSMAVYQLVAPYLADPSDKSWHGPMEAFRTRCQTALESLDGLDLSVGRPVDSRDDSQGQPGVHGRMLEDGDLQRPSNSRNSPAPCALLRQDHRNRGARPGRPLDEGRWPTGRSCSARTGSTPTPPATRFT